jgi:transposase-like protein
MSKGPRVFRPEAKLAVVKRMLSGEEVVALARELKVKRTVLYKWKDRYRKLGAAAFQVRRGRPPKSKPGIADLRPKPLDNLDAAQRRISELERTFSASGHERLRRLPEEAPVNPVVP